MNILKAIRLARKHKLKSRGIVYPRTTLMEADRAGIPLALACALLDQESGGGHNVFGHDAVRNPIKGGNVTKPRYLLYKRYRQQGLGMQGVGPVQLTWYEFQDQADRLGGCWKPKYNMRVGFSRLAALIRAHGEHSGIALYNGAGQAAENYARSVEAKKNNWHNKFSRD